MLHSEFLRQETKSNSSGTRSIGEDGEELFAFFLIVIDLKLLALRDLANFRELLLTHPALRSVRAVVGGKNLRASIITLEINVDVAPSLVVVNA